MRKSLSAIAVSLLLSSPSFATECTAFRGMTIKQIDNIKYAYQLGLPHNYGLTLASIVMKESSGGLYNINIYDPSFSMFHISIKSASRRENVTSSFEINKLAQKLMDDVEFAAGHAIKELNYWKEYHNNDWMRMWASYNAGHKYWNGAEYASEILSHVRKLRKCFKDN